MHIAVCSDIHDNVWVLERALRQMQDAGALVCCGDLCAPFTLVQIASAIAAPIHLVWGNNDGDKWLLTRQAARFPQVELHGELAQLEIGGVRVGVNHYPHIARGLAASGQYDLVCCGHDHTAGIEQIGPCLLVNPGEVMGRLGASTWAVYDTVTRAAEVRPVG